MPTAVPQLFEYSHVPETKEDLDWADCECSTVIPAASLTTHPVPTIDLSKYGSPEGKAELAQTLIEAIRTKGFFYVTNFGVSQDRVSRQFSLGQRFYELPLEEKLKYVPDLENGEYNGYRPAGRRIMGGGLPDQIEVYNIPSKLDRSSRCGGPSLWRRIQWSLPSGIPSVDSRQSA
jgi:isopenicillin N synthase-like dioxygenase